MKNPLYIIAFGIAFGIISCSKEKMNSPLQIRVQNLSAFQINSVKILGDAEQAPYLVENNYGDLGANQITPYQIQKNTYTIPFCKFIAKGELLQFQARCAVGLTKLETGKYTLRIIADSKGNIGNPEFVKD